MGEKGDKLSKTAAEVVENLLSKLSSIDSISSKKMFGGYGVFHDSKMFGMVDSKGAVYLKTNDETAEKFLNEGGAKHSRMPYHRLPEKIRNNEATLLEWINESIKVSK